MGASLKESWANVLASIGSITQYYEVGNKVVSLGLISRLRRYVSRVGSQGLSGVFLDLGSGPGYMGAEVLRRSNPGSLCVLLDALPKMLEASRGVIESPRVDRVLGVFEWLPFRESSFKLVVAAFSLRDSWSLPRTLLELSRALDRLGVLVALDLGKPSSFVKRLLVGAYWRVLARILFVVLGPLGKQYSKIQRTYELLPRNNSLRRLFLRVFKRVEVIELLGGGVVIILAGGVSGHERG